MRLSNFSPGASASVVSASVEKRGSDSVGHFEVHVNVAGTRGSADNPVAAAS